MPITLVEVVHSRTCCGGTRISDKMSGSDRTRDSDKTSGSDRTRGSDGTMGSNRISVNGGTMGSGRNIIVSAAAIYIR